MPECFYSCTMNKPVPFHPLTRGELGATVPCKILAVGQGLVYSFIGLVLPPFFRGVCLYSSQVISGSIALAFFLLLMTLFSAVH